MSDTVDMRPNLPSARDQGTRPTCLAFAVSDAHMVATRRSDFLSSDYLHYHGARRATVSVNTGVGVGAIRDALRLDGQPEELSCPYSGTRSDSWIPPSVFSPIWKRDSRLKTGTASEVLETALRGHRAFVLVLRISRSFHLPDPASYVVTEDLGADRRLHAVLIVGMDSIDSERAFLARNSWGLTWGMGGHAWLPIPYVNSRAVDIIEVEAES